MHERDQVKDYHIVKAKYSMYTPDEVKRLSVKEIYNPVSLDLLYNPNRGGLYDPELGTQAKFQLCEKCGLEYSSFSNKTMDVCPGHMGHISFPLPLFNPITFHHMFMILKSICFKCGVFLKKSFECVLFVREMKALNLGIVTASDDMRVIVRGCLTDVKETNSDVIINDLTSQLDNYIIACMSAVQPGHCIKNTEGLKKACVKAFFDKVPKMCGSCQSVPRNLRHEGMAQIFFTSRKEDKKFDEVRGMDAGERIMLQNIVSQVDARLLLRKLHHKQPDILSILCNTDTTLLSSLSSLKTSLSSLKTSLSSPSSSLLLPPSSSLPPSSPFSSSSSSPTDAFFLDNLLVAPTRTRPMSRFKATLVDKPLTMNLKHILNASLNLKGIITADQKDDMEGKMKAWLDVQTRVNGHFDQNLSRIIKDPLPGIKQLLEKKEGLLRMNMMGKRVNSAARSVISPDPYLACNEVGLPEVFAKKLFVAENVQPRNFETLKAAVINGPHKYPGAHSIEMENRRVVFLDGMSDKERTALAGQLLTCDIETSPYNQTFKKVKRHMKSGDLMLLNRQPTLHKPSMQTFKARVLPMEKTLRINYTSCKAFNADFDGDEMNAHLIEGLPAKAEAATLAIADEQYLVPKDGKPIAGLIQDHMISGVLLTVKGTHFCRREYEGLVYAALPTNDTSETVKMLPPCILKPCTMWSGKQVISTILLNIIPEDSKPLNLRGRSKISDKEWKRAGLGDGKAYDDMSESEVVVMGGELLVGVLDKNQYGATAYGLVHCCYEMYGGRVSSELLSCLARLFTFFLRNHHSFTLGIEDIIISHKGDKARRRAIEVMKGCGAGVVSKALREPGASKEEIEEGLKRVQFSKKKIELLELDGAINSQMTQFQDAIKMSCWPNDLIKPFPANNLQLMVQSGAKGTSVNCMQISCSLGQVDLEGCRPPRSTSGASLPSFRPYDLAPRAGGFIADRFLTGLQCQEFFFHCMAGRDGLVDTAVKTSRSGYLQRCLIKHMEALTVAADGTVRDADGSVIQFKYGEDSLDIMRTAYLQQSCFDHLLDNRHILLDNHVAKQLASLIQLGNVDKIQEYIVCDDQLKAPKIFTVFSRKELPKVRAAHPEEGDEWCMSKVQERFLALRPKKLSKLARKNLPRMKHPLKGVMHRSSQSFLRQVERYIEQKRATNTSLRDITSKSLQGLSDDDLRTLFYTRFLQAEVNAGEAVGILAATSIGEQTTQMTLNTFHFAGHGAMNVTLGIPRLREILLVASREIKTPMMEVPLMKAGVKLEKRVEKLTRKLHRIPLEKIVSKVYVRELICKDASRQYHMRVTVADDTDFKISKQAVVQYLEKIFVTQVVKAIAKHQIELSASGLLVAKKVSTKKMMEEVGGGGDGKVDMGAGMEDKSDSEDEEKEDEVVLSRKKDKEYADEDDDDDDVDSDGEKEGGEKEGGEKEVGEKEGEMKKEDGGADDDTAKDGRTDESPPAKRIKLEKGGMGDDDDDDDDDGLCESAEYIRRRNYVRGLKHVLDYSYDPKEHAWMEVVLLFSNFSKEMDIQSVIDTELRKTVINQVPGISKGMIKPIDNKNSANFIFMSAKKEAQLNGTPLKKKLQIEGLNIQEVYKYQDKLCVNQLYTNDIHTIATTYGIEAAVQSIIEEIRSVFKAYGIDVDYRHLSLIADYMTFEGQFKAFNRFGMENNASPLQKMSFESALNALKKIIHEGGEESFESPSACLMVGKPIKTGTGYTDLLMSVK